MQAVADVDPHPADPFRGLYVTDEAALSLAHAASPGAEFEERLLELGGRLGLSALEVAVLAVCAAPELGPHYGRLFAYLHDDVTRKLPTPRLAARLLGGGDVLQAEVLAAFARAAPLRRTGALRILDDDPALPLEDRPVRVAERLVSELLGVELHASSLADRLRRVAVPDFDVGRPSVVAQLRGVLAGDDALPVLVAGPDAPQLLAAALSRAVLLAEIAELADEAARSEVALVCALEGRCLVLDGLDAIEPAEARRRLADIVAPQGRIVLCAASPELAASLAGVTAATIEVPAPTFAERRAAWRALSGCDEVDDVAAKFRLSLADVAVACDVARVAARARDAPCPAPPDLDEGARRASHAGLHELASRLDAVAGWEDLILPAHQLDVLRSICAYLRHRDRVLAEWGYDRTIARNQGLKALFAGSSGTGKTLAGRVLARELGLDLFRIDLATVVSKYVGETEKNLARVFAAAEGSNAILFFDEADALLGKRSDVADAHDRYANIEVAYLLQRMETYPGAVVLATNLRQNIDEAFVRRLDFIVDFPFPEEDDRARLWRMLVPARAPLDDDVDLGFLAARFKLSGGAIRNCSVSAAFMAAEEGTRIGMDHLVRAVALEYGKLGRLTLEADFERFHGLVRHHTGNGATAD